MYVTDLVAMQTADPEVLALCESWDMHCRRRLRKPRRRHRHRWHRCKAVTETHPLAYPKWVIPAICTLFYLYYIFILQISYTVNMIIWYIHLHIHIYIYFYSSSNMMFEMVWSLLFFSNETFQHQMICLAFLKKTGGKAAPKSLSDPTAETGHGSTSRGRPETGRDRERPWETTGWVCKNGLQQKMEVPCLSLFQVANANDLKKSLGFAGIYFNMPKHASHASTLHASKKKNIWVKCFGICQRFEKKKGRYVRYVRYVNAKDAKDAWISEMRAMSPHSWHAFACLCMLPSNFTSRLHVIPSQCQAFMASVARD